MTKEASSLCAIYTCNNQSPTILGDSAPNILLNSCGISLEYIIPFVYSKKDNNIAILIVSSS